jgi:hypothetical protein
MPATGQSRRNLLKAAVIGSAAVAATAGATTAALALTGNKSVISLTQVDWILPGSPGYVCDVCTTDQNCNTLDTLNGKQRLYLWLRFLNVTAGTYWVDVSPTILPYNALCPTQTPFRYHSQGGTPQSNSVTVWVLPPKNYECHPHAQSELSGVPHSSFSVLPNNNPTTFTINATQCVLVQVDLDYFCVSGNHTYMITGFLKQGSTINQSCMHQITIS